MAFFWNRPFFQRPPETGPAPGAADSRSASIPAAAGALHRHLPSSNHWPMVMLFGTIAALYFAREILIPLAFALILTFVLSPVVALLEKSRIGRIPSVVVTALVTMAAAGCVAWVIAIQLVDVAKELPRYGQNIDAKMEALRVPTKGRLGLAANNLKEIARQLSTPAAAPPPEPGPRVQDRNQSTAPGTGIPLPVQIVPQPANGLDYPGGQQLEGNCAPAFHSGGGTPSGTRSSGAGSEPKHCAGHRDSSARTDRATAGQWIGLPWRSGPARSPASGTDLTCPDLHGFHAGQEIRLDTSSFPAGGTRSDQPHDASARRRGATCQPIPVDAGPGQCRLWSSVRIRSVLHWRALSRAMGSRRRPAAHRAVYRHDGCRRAADRTLVGRF